jgi:hypothetical protein
VSSVRSNIARCLRGAARCRLEADNAPNAFEKESWLDLADLWTELADAFEDPDQPTLH